MTKNMGFSHRILRLLGALILAVLFFTGVLSGTVGIISLIIAVILAMTGFIGWCPAYLPFRISTKRNSKRHKLSLSSS